MQEQQPEVQAVIPSAPEDQPGEKKMSAQQRKSVIERLWLIYYNDTLLKQGLITEDEHRRMRTKIYERKPSHPSR